MKPSFLLFLFLLSTHLCVAIAQVAPLSAELIEARGNGCPPGTISSTLAPDGSALSVLFSQFTARSNSEVDPRQKSVCNLVIRLRMAPGYGVGIVTADYRGFVSLTGPNARAVFKSGWVLRDNGQKVATGPEMNQSFGSSFNDSFYVRQTTPDIQWIGCNDRQARLILQSSVIAVARKGSESLITVDSADAASVMKFYLSVKPCGT